MRPERVCAKSPCFSQGLGFPLTGNKKEKKEGEQEKTSHGRPMGISHVVPVRCWWRDIPLHPQCSRATCGGGAGGGWQGLLSRNLAWESRVPWWAQNDFTLRLTGKEERWRKGRWCLVVIAAIWHAFWGVCFTYYWIMCTTFFDLLKNGRERQNVTTCRCVRVRSEPGREDGPTSSQSARLSPRWLSSWRKRPEVIYQQCNA